MTNENNAWELAEMASKLDHSNNFAYQNIVKTTIINDVVLLRLSLDDKETWVNGYIENSRWIKGVVHSHGDEGYTVSFMHDYRINKMREVHKPKSADKILKHIQRELDKVN